MSRAQRTSLLRSLQLHASRAPLVPGRHHARCQLCRAEALSTLRARALGGPRVYAVPHCLPWSAAHHGLLQRQSSEA